MPQTWEQRDKEKRRASGRAWYALHREAQQEKSRRYQASHKEERQAKEATRVLTPEQKAIKRAKQQAWYRVNRARVNEMAKAWYRANPERVRMARARARQKRDLFKYRPPLWDDATRRRLVQGMKVGRGCAHCGYSDNLAALVWHHFDKATKAFNVSQARGRSAEEILEEIGKCILLCANCHFIEHGYKAPPII